MIEKLTTNYTKKYKSWCGSITAMDKGSTGPISDLTVPERILLHLLEHNRAADEYTRPVTVTQEGIAAAIGVRRSHVSYCLKELEDRGGISEKLRHIENRTRRRKAYSLTQSGTKNAVELRRSLMDSSVPTPSGEMTVKKIMSSDRRKPTLTGLIRTVRDSGSYHPGAGTDEKDHGLTDGLIIFSVEGVEACPDFTGRAKELEDISRWLGSSEGRIFVVHGMAGIGKTSLGFHAANRARATRNLFWHTCEEWNTPRALAISLGDFLDKMDKGDLKGYLRKSIVLDLGEVLRLTESGLRKRPVLMVLDDLQKASNELKNVVRMLVKLVSRSDDIKLLLLSRNLPDLYRTRDALIGKAVREKLLEGLPREDCTTLLQKWGLDGSGKSGRTVEKIYLDTQGHPLAMELARNRNFEGSTLRDIARFFREEVLRNLTRQEEDMLSLASLYRTTIPDRGLFLYGGDYRTLDTLVERSLLKESPEGYVLHDVLKEVMSARLPERKKKRLHELIGELYISEARGGQVRSALLSAHHFIQAGDFEADADAILDYGVALFGEGYLEDILGSIDELLFEDERTGECLTPAKRDALLCLKGNLLTFTGDLGEAGKILKELGGRMDFSGSVDIVHARVHNGLGIIAYKKGDRDAAISNYEKAMGITEECGDREFLAKVLSNLGVLYWEGDEGEKARAAHLRAMELCWELDDREGVARAYNNLGIICFKEREFEKAERMFEKGLVLSKNIGHMRIAAAALNNLGDSSREMGDEMKAMRYYTEGLKLSRKHDLKWQQAEALKALLSMSRGVERKKYSDELEILTARKGAGMEHDGI